MANPKKKRSSSRSKRSRAHLALKTVQVNICTNCKSPVLPHRACANCGTYKGKVVVSVRPSKAERELEKKSKSKQKPVKKVVAKTAKPAKVAKKATKETSTETA